MIPDRITDDDTSSPATESTSKEAPPPKRGRRFFDFGMLYRIAGAALAVCGALLARLFSEAVPAEQRIWFWIAGTICIFGGLYLVCVPTRRRHGAEQEAEEVAASPDDEAPRAANDP